MRALYYSLLAMLLCALSTYAVFLFFTIPLAPLAIVSMLLALITTLFTAGAPAQLKVKGQDVLLLLWGIAMNTVGYFALLSGVGGGIFYLALLAASLGLMVASGVRFEKEYSIASGLLGGFVMFVVALVLVSFISYIIAAPLEELAAMAMWGWGAAGNSTLQTSALQMFFIVAPIEEAWRYSTLAALSAAGTGAGAATWLANAWFVFLHTPSRMAYGWVGVVVVGIIGIVVIPFWYLAGRKHIVSAMVAHATYNVLIGSLGPMLLIELPILGVLVYLLRRHEMPGIRIELREEELSLEKLLKRGE